MILLTAKMIKIVLLIMAIAGGVYLFRNKVSKKHLVYLSVLMVCFALAAQTMSGLVPPLTDEITLTALGEKNEASEAEEIFLQSITVEGEEVAIGRLVEGKWFWRGEAIGWRIETDSRQPEGVTRTVVLRVPVGWARTLNFEGSTRGGLVEVKTAHGSQVIDTYRENTIVPAVIGRSSTSQLIFNQICYLAVYIAVLAGLLVCTVWIVKWALENPQQAGLWLKRHSGKLIYGSIALVTFVVMVYYADSTSLWIDELMAIDFTNGSIFEAIKFCLDIREYHPPLFDIIATVWYHIAPYGEKWLLLVSIVPCVIATYITGVIGEQIKDKWMGTIAALLFATSTSGWVRQAYEYRPYAVLVMFFSLTMYCFVKRSRDTGVVRWRILYSLFLLCMGMTDYFGMVACAEFFAADVYLIAKKKIHWKTVIDYVFPGLICFAWVGAIINYMVHTDRFYGNWSMPNLQQVLNTFRLISGELDGLYWILFVGLGIGIVRIWFQNGQNDTFSWQYFYLSCCAWIVIFTIVGPIVIAKLLNQPATIWVERFFLFLRPCSCLLMGNAMIFLIEMAKGNLVLYKTILCVCTSAALAMNCFIVVSKLKSSDTYRESANWIYQQDDIFSDETIILVDEWNFTKVGYQEYYISRQGQRDALNVDCVPYMTKEKLLQYNKIYLLYCHYGIQWDMSRLNYIDEYYNLEMDNANDRVLVYSRK